jgi:hypothetical protein
MRGGWRAPSDPTDGGSPPAYWRLTAGVPAAHCPRTGDSRRRRPRRPRPAPYPKDRWPKGDPKDERPEDEPKGERPKDRRPKGEPKDERPKDRRPKGERPRAVDPTISTPAGLAGDQLAAGDTAVRPAAGCLSTTRAKSRTDRPRGESALVNMNGAPELRALMAARYSLRIW